MSFDFKSRGYEGRHWYPDELMDEMLPEANRAAPEDWIKRVEGNEAVFFGFEDDPEWRVAFGAAVKFHWSEYRGCVDIVVAADGSWQGGPEPADYNHCWAPADSDTIGESISDTARLCLECYKPGPFTVECAKWSEGAEGFELQRDGDGAKLVPIGRVQ